MSKTNEVFSALSDSTRRKILEMLKNRDMTPSEIVEAFNITKPALTFHLNILKKAELVTSERKGQNILYSLNMSVFEELIEAFFAIFKKNN